MIHDDDQMRILVTGGLGFIGANLVKRLERRAVTILDSVTYAATPPNEWSASQSVTLIRGDVSDRDAVQRAFDIAKPQRVIHLAAESHVDRSISDPASFMQTNILGTGVLLEAAQRHLDRLDAAEAGAFRFMHVSTDEVFGSLSGEGAFHEESPYRPNSPYSASKAASDHLVRAWNRTYSLPTVTTNCSNNYGPHQHDEKLIPTVIRTALSGADIPIYGAGANIRDWLYVGDHVEALVTIMAAEAPDAQYCIGGGVELRNLDLCRKITAHLDRMAPKPGGGSYADQIAFVEDRKGHDFRYAIDSDRLTAHLGWRPQRPFEDALAQTVRWYLEHRHGR